MIGISTDGALWTLTLDRAEKANALTHDMLEALDAGVARAGAGGAQALILTGKGGVFSAGADLGEMRGTLATDPLWERLSARLAGLPCLTIAALNGTLAGGAMGMVLACDIRIAVPSATFFYPVMQRGYLPQPSDPARLTALIGPSRARMILLAGARPGAEEALAWGLIDRIVPPESLLDAAKELAAAALAAPASHVAALKRMVR